MNKNEFTKRLIFFLFVVCWCSVLFFLPICKVHTIGHYNSGLLDYHQGPMIPEDKIELDSCGGFRFFHVLGFSVYFYIFFPVILAAEILLFKRPLRWYWIGLISLQFLFILFLTPIFIFMMSWRLELFTNEKNEFSPAWGAWIAVAGNVIFSILIFSSVFFRRGGLSLLYRERK
jgi:hypothetical protein